MGFLSNTGLERLWTHIQTEFNDLQSGFSNLQSQISNYVPITRTINSKELSDDIALTASDVGAIANDLPVVTSQNYGTALPSTGVEGQIFFKQVT